MPVLKQSKHEKFAQLVAKGVSATKAYVSAGYAEVGASQNASRLSGTDKVLARIKELQEAISDGVVACEVRKRSARASALIRSDPPLLSKNDPGTVIWGLAWSAAVLECYS